MQQPQQKPEVKVDAETVQKVGVLREWYREQEVEALLDVQRRYGRRELAN